MGQSQTAVWQCLIEPRDVTVALLKLEWSGNVTWYQASALFRKLRDFLWPTAGHAFSCKREGWNSVFNWNKIGQCFARALQLKRESAKLPYDCTKLYIGETGRDLNVRIKEHKRAVSLLKEDNGISSHAKNSGHSNSLGGTSMLYRCNNFKLRRVIESAFLHTNRRDTINQNIGFYPLGSSLSKLIVSSVT